MDGVERSLDRNRNWSDAMTSVQLLVEKITPSHMSRDDEKSLYSALESQI